MKLKESRTNRQRYHYAKRMACAGNLMVCILDNPGSPEQIREGLFSTCGCPLTKLTNGLQHFQAPKLYCASTRRHMTKPSLARSFPDKCKHNKHDLSPSAISIHQVHAGREILANMFNL